MAKEDKPLHEGAPEIIGSATLLTSPHDLTEDVDPQYAGEYQLTVGTVRIPEPDGSGGFKPRGRVVRAGSKLRLNALDAHRFLSVGVVKRIDGKRPDRIEQSESAA